MVRIAALVILLAGCDVGEVPIGGGGPDGGGGAGAASFSAMITPLVTECAVVACHLGPQIPILTSFADLGPQYKTKPGAANILVTKGGLTGGIHQAIPYLTATEQATVAAWIDSL